MGIWNVFANPEMPNPQAALLSLLCPPTTTDCSEASLLPKTLSLFKTPGLRDLDDSAPYLHSGTAGNLQAVLSQYQRVSGLQRSGMLRNGDPRLGNISLGAQDIAPLEAFLHALAEDYQ